MPYAATVNAARTAEPAARRGRPPIVTPERIVEAGIAVTLERLTVTAVAAELGVTTAALHQHIDGVDGMRRMVAEEILRRGRLPEVSGTDLGEDLLSLAVGLRSFVHDNPGIGQYLARIDSTSEYGLTWIDTNHAAFATAYALSPTTSAWLVSTVAEHAIALASVVYTREPRPRGGRAAIDARTDLVNLPQVQIRRDDRDDDWFFRWSMRAVVIGAIELSADLP